MIELEVSERRRERMLAHPLRVAMLRYLLEHEQAHPALLAAGCGAAYGNVAYHVGCLREAGELVVVGTLRQRGGAGRVYRLRDPDAVREALSREERAANRSSREHVAASVAAHEQLGAAIREFRSRRVAQGLTRRAFARRLGMAPSRLARIERGELDPPLTVVIQIARELGTTLGEIFTVVES